MLSSTLSLFCFWRTIPRVLRIRIEQNLIVLLPLLVLLHRPVLSVYRNLFMRFLGAIVLIVLRQTYDINSMLYLGCLFRKTSVLAILPSIYHLGSCLANRPSSPASRHNQSCVLRPTGSPGSRPNFVQFPSNSHLSPWIFHDGIHREIEAVLTAYRIRVGRTR